MLSSNSDMYIFTYCTTMDTVLDSADRAWPNLGFFPQIFKLWQNTHNIKFTTLTIFKCTVKWAQGHSYCATIITTNLDFKSLSAISSKQWFSNLTSQESNGAFTAYCFLGPTAGDPALTGLGLIWVLGAIKAPQAILVYSWVENDCSKRNRAKIIEKWSKRSWKTPLLELQNFPNSSLAWLQFYHGFLLKKSPMKMIRVTSTPTRSSGLTWPGGVWCALYGKPHTVLFLFLGQKGKVSPDIHLHSPGSHAFCLALLLISWSRWPNCLSSSVVTNYMQQFFNLSVCGGVGVARGSMPKLKFADSQSQ